MGALAAAAWEEMDSSKDWGTPGRAALTPNLVLDNSRTPLLRALNLLSFLHMVLALCSLQHLETSPRAGSMPPLQPFPGSGAVPKYLPPPPSPSP